MILHDRDQVYKAWLIEIPIVQRVFKRVIICRDHDMERQLWNLSSRCPPWLHLFLFYFLDDLFYRGILNRLPRFQYIRIDHLYKEVLLSA